MENHIDSGDELLDTEGLNEVVVASNGQTAHPVLNGVGGREKDDRGVHSCEPEPPTHFKAVQVRKLHVKDNEILGVSLRGKAQRVASA
jgi:hypothetical protein